MSRKSLRQNCYFDDLFDRHFQKEKKSQYHNYHQRKQICSLREEWNTENGEAAVGWAGIGASSQPTALFLMHYLGSPPRDRATGSKRASQCLLAPQHWYKDHCFPFVMFLVSEKTDPHLQALVQDQLRFNLSFLSPACVPSPLPASSQLCSGFQLGVLAQVMEQDPGGPGAQQHAGR